MSVFFTNAHLKSLVKSPVMLPVMSLVRWLAILAISLSASLVRAQYANAIDIPFERFTLDNGLTLLVHEDRKAPIVTVNIWYHVGSKDERPGITGFAHLFEHLMFNGSENYNDEWFLPLQKAGHCRP